MQISRNRISGELQEKVQEWPLSKVEQELRDLRWHIKHGGSFGSWELSWQLVLEEELAKQTQINEGAEL